MWFQAAETAFQDGQCELIVKFDKQQHSDFLTENLHLLNPFSPKKSENLRPHYSQPSHENVTPSSGTSLLASCKGEPPFPPGV